jgi:hypothetical protein
MSNSNPDNRKPKPIRNPKLPKLQKNKPGYDNEMDLWNLEDDAASSPSVTPIEESRINETSTTSEKTDKPKEAVAAEVDSQPFAEIEVPAELQSTAEDETDHAPSITVNTIDQKRSISHKYRYETPERLAVAPTEEEIWGDFVDDVKLEQPEDQDAPAAPPAEEEVAVVLTKIDVEPAKPSVAKIITHERKKPA